MRSGLHCTHSDSSCLPRPEYCTHSKLAAAVVRYTSDALEKQSNSGSSSAESVSIAPGEAAWNECGPEYTNFVPKSIVKAIPSSS